MLSRKNIIRNDAVGWRGSHAAASLSDSDKTYGNTIKLSAAEKPSSSA